MSDEDRVREALRSMMYLVLKSGLSPGMLAILAVQELANYLREEADRADRWTSKEAGS